MVHGSWEWALDGFRFDLETRVKPKTVEYYCGRIRLFVRWAKNSGQVADPSLLTKRDIQSFLHQLTEASDLVSLGNGTQRSVRRTDASRWPYYRALKHFCAWAVNEGYIKQNPVEGIKLKAPKDQPVEPYRCEHLDSMMKALDHQWQVATTSRQRMLAARDRAVLFLFLESGLRLGELARLSLPDMDLEARRATVREGKMGKGRLAGFGVQTKKALWRYLGLRPGEAQHQALWLTEEARPMTKHGIQEIIRRLKKEAGLQHVKGSVHKLRHTFATTFLRHTRDMKGCRILLGHSTLAMTERYTQFIEAEDVLKSYDGQGPLDWMRESKEGSPGS